MWPGESCTLDLIFPRDPSFDLLFSLVAYVYLKNFPERPFCALSSFFSAEMCIKVDETFYGIIMQMNIVCGIVMYVTTANLFGLDVIIKLIYIRQQKRRDWKVNFQNLLVASI